MNGRSLESLPCPTGTQKGKETLRDEHIIAVREEPSLHLEPYQREVTNVKRSGEWLNMESRNLVSGDLMKHDTDIQQHDGEGTNLDRSCRTARLCFSLRTVTQYGDEYLWSVSPRCISMKLVLP